VLAVLLLMELVAVLLPSLVGWRFGLDFSDKALVSINEVTQHRVRLVLGWVTL